jgi:hypothetical protein
MAEYLGCSACRHRDSKGLTCKAFPKRIPLQIISGEIHHTKRLRWQDNDIVYEPIEVKIPSKA